MPDTSNSDISPPDTVTVEVARSAMDSLKASDEENALYYLILDGQDSTRQEVQDHGPDTLFREIRETDLIIKNAWYPLLNSVEVECGIANNFQALIIHLESPSTEIEDFGFISNPKEHDPPAKAINCGIEKYEHYTFD